MGAWGVAAVSVWERPAAEGLLWSVSGAVRPAELVAGERRGAAEKCVTSGISMNVAPSPGGTRVDGDDMWGAMKPTPMEVVGSLEPAADSLTPAVVSVAGRRRADHVEAECHSAAQRRMVLQQYDG